MKHTIKIYRSIAGMACLVAALNLAGCSCNAKHDGSGADTAKTDSASVKKDSIPVAKKDTTDSTTMKMAPADSLASPANHTPKKDTTTTPRPIDRKTKS